MLHIIIIIIIIIITTTTTIIIIANALYFNMIKQWCNKA
jgi:multisubunit Na+/H+ antiporter MnhG subunit